MSHISENDWSQLCSKELDRADDKLTGKRPVILVYGNRPVSSGVGNKRRKFMIP